MMIRESASNRRDYSSPVDVSGKPAYISLVVHYPLLPAEHRLPYLLFRLVLYPGITATINIGDVRERRSIITVITQRKVLNRQLMGCVCDRTERMYAVRCQQEKSGAYRMLRPLLLRV